MPTQAPVLSPLHPPLHAAVSDVSMDAPLSPPPLHAPLKPPPSSSSPECERERERDNRLRALVDTDPTHSFISMNDDLDLDIDIHLTSNVDTTQSPSHSASVSASASASTASDTSSAPATVSLSSSSRSGSETYVTDLGGPVVRDETDWTNRISRQNAQPVYLSSSDSDEPLSPSPARRHAQALLAELARGHRRVYSDWALEADDALELEELQHEALAVEDAIDRYPSPLPPVTTHDPPPLALPIDPQHPHDNLPAVDSTFLAREFGPGDHPPEHDALSDLDISDASISPVPARTPRQSRSRRKPRRRASPPPSVISLPSADGNELADTPSPVYAPVVSMPSSDADATSSPVYASRIVSLPSSDADAATPSPAYAPRIVSLPSSDADAATPSPAYAPRIVSLRSSDTENPRSPPWSPAGAHVSRIVSLPNSESDVSGCRAQARLPPLKQRLQTVLSELASLQMITASNAADAEVHLGSSEKSSGGVLRGEVCRLKITLDHLARLTLAEAFHVRDRLEAHK